MTLHQFKCGFCGFATVAYNDVLYCERCTDHSNSTIKVRMTKMQAEGTIDEVLNAIENESSHNSKSESR